MTTYTNMCWVIGQFVGTGVLRRLVDARKALRNLASASVSGAQLDANVAMIGYTNEMERLNQEGTSYIDYFRGTNLRPIVGTFLSWFLLPHIGRRTLYVYSLAILFTILTVVGCMGVPAPQESLGWASGVFFTIFVITYDMTIGSICYCLVAEIPSTRLRIKTVAIARNAYLLVSIGWAYFYLPEPKGRSAAELEKLFEQGISTRNFSSTEVVIFTEESSEKGDSPKVDMVEGK
ncbi:uncharacterized protein FTOL_12098 [Fusarium torulosum]|uniref:Major facilitator superfamily (MFS) profile domain-containing protein n=1 Tax=Fusarium torulosum TaxID=33205 RepID=A0AAE8MLM2_9HYPO|nr:uncharacterized protein FTOL_12098 [Fusarium torulosum]